MKRIISLCCVCLTLFMSLAVPARADEVSENLFLDVLQYSTVDDLGNNYFSFSQERVISYTLPQKAIFSYVDMVISFSGAAPTYVGAGRNGEYTALTILKISDRLYRVYGPIDNSAYSTLDFRFVSGSSSTSWVNVEQLHIARQGFNIFDETLYATGDYGDTSFELSLDLSDLTRQRYIIFDFDGAFNDADFSLIADFPNWKKYDFIDVGFFFDCSSITSISCQMGGTVLPFTSSIVESTNLEGSGYLVNLRIDLRGLDRTIDDWPMISIYGICNNSVSNIISLSSAKGYVLSSEPNDFLYYFTKLYAHIDLGFDNLSDWMADQTAALQTEIQDAVISLSMEFTNLKAAISTHFTSLDTWIQNQTESISGFFATHNTLIGQKFTQLFGELTLKFRDLEAAIRGDPEPGEDFQDQVEDKDKELDDMAAVMDSVTKPDIDDIDVSIDQFVNPSDVALLATPLTVFLEADLFRTMVIMSILLATVSYTLYGKR